MTEPLKLNVADGTLPWTKSCFVCGEANPHGLRLKSRVEGDRVVLRYVTGERDVGWKHIVHGGLTMTLLDEVMTWAAILALRRACVAAELTVRLRKPVGVNAELTARGWAAAARARLVTTEGEVLNAAGDVVASATGKYVPMAGEAAVLTRADFVRDAVALDPDGLL